MYMRIIIYYNYAYVMMPYTCISLLIYIPITTINTHIHHRTYTSPYIHHMCYIDWSNNRNIMNQLTNIAARYNAMTDRTDLAKVLIYTIILIYYTCTIYIHSSVL